MLAFRFYHNCKPCTAEGVLYIANSLTTFKLTFGVHPMITLHKSSLFALIDSVYSWEISQYLWEISSYFWKFLCIFERFPHIMFLDLKRTIWILHKVLFEFNIGEDFLIIITKFLASIWYEKEKNKIFWNIKPYT